MICCDRRALVLVSASWHQPAKHRCRCSRSRGPTKCSSRVPGGTCRSSMVRSLEPMRCVASMQVRCQKAGNVRRYLDVQCTGIAVTARQCALWIFHDVFGWLCGDVLWGDRCRRRCGPLAEVPMQDRGQRRAHASKHALSSMSSTFLTPCENGAFHKPGHMPHR